MTTTEPHPHAPTHVEVLWLVWDCTELAGAFTTRAAAEDHRQALIERIDRDFGPRRRWHRTVTVVRAQRLLDPIPPVPGASKPAHRNGTRL